MLAYADVCCTRSRRGYVGGSWRLPRMLLCPLPSTSLPSGPASVAYVIHTYPAPLPASLDLAAIRSGIRSIRQHTSAYVSILARSAARFPRPRCHQVRAAYASIRQHTPAYVSIRQHTYPAPLPASLDLASLPSGPASAAAYADVC
jgi:hypothetical protein